MYSFGMLGSYFSQGVYAVAGPFQGAVDIIVVQQQDGTFKSSPWYVRCGDFQGVLKRREKIVEILVNGVKANFYMLLNNRGEAYFEKEVEDAVLALPSSSSSAPSGGRGEISNSETSSTSDIAQLQETATNKLEGLSTSKGEAMSKPLEGVDMDTPSVVGSSQTNGTDKFRGLSDSVQACLSEHPKPPNTATGNIASGNTSELGEANMPAQLNLSLDHTDISSVQGGDTTSKQGEANLPNLLTSFSNKLLHAQVKEDSTEIDNGSSEMNTMHNVEPHESELEEALGLDVNPTVISANGGNLGCGERNAMHNADSFQSTEPHASESKEELGSDVNPTVFSVNEANLILAEPDNRFLTQLMDHDISASNQNVTTDTIREEVLEIADAGSDRADMGETVDAGSDRADMGVLVSDGMVTCNLKTVITEDWFGLQRATGSECGDEEAANRVAEPNERRAAKALDELIWNDYKIVTAEEERELHDALNKASLLGVHLDDDERWKSDMEIKKETELIDTSVWVSDALASDATNPVAITIADDNTRVQDSGGDGSMKGDKAVVGKVEEGHPPTGGNKAVEIPTIPPPPRWSMWPLSFRKSRIGTTSSPQDAGVQKQALLAAANIAVGSPLTEEILRKNGYYEWPQKPKLCSYVPTSDQIESLKLKEGPNKVTFTFPRVLGRTQVDANIFLWKWNTRIVISDVDGTITKSDVLGQVMPLVGRDWSQLGVARLFSSIKENGYEVLFLSARAISQAYLTRQFLVNLNQDGENLPEGPVFISPDGLIPSLYREVVRRAPHEFKISCLEGIRQLFPSDVNPFYAGFGNRITDEISYAKVGIPKGKIFTINPKGEVMVNHHVHVKSYTSIHALVDDMFPPVSSSEQEDFNSWNFWKIPLPEIEDEPSAPQSSKTKKGGNTKRGKAIGA